MMLSMLASVAFVTLRTKPISSDLVYVLPFTEGNVLLMKLRSSALTFCNSFAPRFLFNIALRKARIRVFIFFVGLESMAFCRPTIISICFLLSMVLVSLIAWNSGCFSINSMVASIISASVSLVFLFLLFFLSFSLKFNIFLNNFIPVLAPPSISPNTAGILRNISASKESKPSTSLTFIFLIRTR